MTFGKNQRKNHEDDEDTAIIAGKDRQDRTDKRDESSTIESTQLETGPGQVSPERSLLLSRAIRTRVRRR